VGTVSEESRHPNQLIRQELRDTLKLLAKGRSIVSRQFDVISARLNQPDITPDQVAALCEIMPTLMAALNKNLEICGKYTFGKDTPETESTNPTDPKDILKELRNI
jgi:hypothetical protein